MFSISSVYQDLSVFKDLPDLLWIHVFEQLTRPQDRHNIIQTCRKFYLLGLRELYTELTFRHMPPLFFNNDSFWENRKDAMVTAPRSVSVYGSSIRPQRRILAENRPVPDERLTFPMLELPRTLMDRLSMFPNIREMVFDGIPLPFEFYNFLFLFPNLRELEVTNCVLPRRPSLPSISLARRADIEPETLSIYRLPPFEDLPITRLCITGSKWFVNHSSAMFSAVGSIVSSREDMDYLNFLHLATAKTLRNLHTNWNIQTAKFFGALTRGRLVGFDFLHSEPDSEPRTHIWSFPSHLTTLRLTTRTKSDWLRVPFPKRHRQRRVYTVNLARLLKACSKTKSLRNLEIEGHLHPFPNPRDRVRMIGLESYEGPLEFLRSVWGMGVELKRIKIVEPERELMPRWGRSSEWSRDRERPHTAGLEVHEGALSWKQLYEAFSEERGRNYASVEELDLKILGSWEDGIMRNIVRMFGELRELKLELVGGKWGGGFIDEIALKNMASQHLVRLPHLSTFHVYNKKRGLVRRYGYGQNPLVRHSEALSSPSPDPHAGAPSPTFLSAACSVSPTARSSSFSKATFAYDQLISEIITTWSKGLSSTHRLTEIRLAPNSIWRRASADPDDDEWCKRVLARHNNQASDQGAGDNDSMDFSLSADGVSGANANSNVGLIPDMVFEPREHVRFDAPLLVIEIIGRGNRRQETGGAELDTLSRTMYEAERENARAWARLMNGVSAEEPFGEVFIEDVD